MLFLVVQNTDSNYRRIAVTRTVTVGRSADCELRIAHPKVSRRHCQILVEQDIVRVRDLGSSNNTLLNGRPLIQNVAFELGHGDELTIGVVRLTADFHGGPSERTEDPPEEIDSSGGVAALAAAAVASATGEGDESDVFAEDAFSSDDGPRDDPFATLPLEEDESDADTDPDAADPDEVAELGDPSVADVTIDTADDGGEVGDETPRADGVISLPGGLPQDAADEMTFEPVESAGEIVFDAFDDAEPESSEEIQTASAETDELAAFAVEESDDDVAAGLVAEDSGAEVAALSDESDSAIPVADFDDVDGTDASDADVGDAASDDAEPVSVFEEEGAGDVVEAKPDDDPSDEAIVVAADSEEVELDESDLEDSAILDFLNDD